MLFRSKGYPNDLVVESRTTGYLLGASLRLFNIAQTLFFHLYYDWSFHNVGRLNTIDRVRDHTQHFGGMLELGLGRRISLYGTMFLRNSHAFFASPPPDFNPSLRQYNTRDVSNIGEEPTWYPGLSLLWDFHVVPHGSLGLLAHVERDIYSVAISMAIEPAPPKKFNLSFEEMNK